MNSTEAATAVRTAVTRRRNRLAASGLTDSGTQALIYLLDRVFVSWSTRAVTVSITPTAVRSLATRYADNVLTAALDGIEGGTAHKRDDLTYVLTF